MQRRFEGFVRSRRAWHRWVVSVGTCAALALSALTGSAQGIAQPAPPAAAPAPTPAPVPAPAPPPAGVPTDPAAQPAPAAPPPAQPPPTQPLPAPPPAEPPPAEPPPAQPPPPMTEPPPETVTLGEAQGETAEEDDASPSTAGPFSKGSIGISVMVGSAYFGDKDYFIFGLGLSYFLVDGLSLGVDGSIWLFDEPTIGTITPNARYVLHMVPVIKPYVGGFWKRYLIGEDYKDFSSVGGRVGAYLMPTRSYLGIGAVYEHILDCKDVILECDSWYPELTFGVSL